MLTRRTLIRLCANQKQTTATVATPIEKATEEFNELRSRLLLKYADAENLRKRRDEARKVAELDQMKKFVKRMTAVADEVLEIAEKWKNEKSGVSDGIVMTANAMKNTLSKHDIEIFAPSQDQQVDERTMDIVQGAEGKTVAHVTKNGWTFKGELIKKATVQVKMEAQ